MITNPFLDIFSQIFSIFGVLKYRENLGKNIRFAAGMQKCAQPTPLSPKTVLFPLEIAILILSFDLFSI